MMKPAIAFIGVILLPLSQCSLLAQNRTHEMPPTIERAQNSSFPLWVSTRVAIDPSGDLNQALFSEAALYILDKNRQENVDGVCKTALSAPTPEDFLARQSFDDLVGNSLAIITGPVVAVDIGFHSGTPGTLLEVSVTDRLKSFGRLSGPTAYVFVPSATIQTTRGTICSRLPAAIPVPAIGDRIL